MPQLYDASQFDSRGFPLFASVTPEPPPILECGGSESEEAGDSCSDGEDSDSAAMSSEALVRFA